MFRDTCAVELLNKGVPIDRVSLPLGHSSVKVTEKHYAPFVKERQQQLEMYARMAWEDAGVDATAIPGGVRPGIEARLCSTQLSLRTRS